MNGPASGSAPADASPDRSTDPVSALLSHGLEAFQAVSVGDTWLVISALDELAIGEGTELADYTERDVRLYAENLLVSGRFQARSAVVGVHALSTSGDGVVLSTAGAAGIDQIVPHVSAGSGGGGGVMRGKDGGPGADGGALSLFIGAADGVQAPVRLVATGGRGGSGQAWLTDGNDKGAGGNGGKGGDGGTVTVVSCHAATRCLDQLARLKNQPGLEERRKAVRDLLGSYLARLAESTAGKAAALSLKTAVQADSVEQFSASLTDATWDLAGVSMDYQSATSAAVRVDGGSYGVYGDGPVPGADGVAGSDGAKKISVIGLPEDLLRQDFPGFFLIHPSQCARVLETIRLRYLVLDPLNGGAIGDLSTLMKRLRERTALFAEAPEDSALVTYYRAHEQENGAIGAVDHLRSVHDTVNILISQLAAGQDAFGHRADHVPLGSFGFYREQLGQMIQVFGDVQATYDGYYTALADDKAASEQIRSALDQARGVVTTAQTDLGRLADMLRQTAQVILSYQMILPALRDKLKAALDADADAVRSCFGANYDTFQQALSTLAFAPESAFMAAAQSGGILYSAYSKVTDDTGVPVNKDYLIAQIKAVEGSIDAIQEGFATVDHGMLAPDDPGAAKLVAAEQAFEQVMKSVNQRFGAELENVRAAFMAYIEKVIERNNHILTYNAEVQLALKNRQLIAAMNARTAALSDRAAGTLDPALPDLATFVSSLYYTHREQIMQTLSLAARAHRFWALSDRDLLRDAYGGKTPPRIDHAALEAAQLTVLEAYQTAVENFGTDRSAFPADPTRPGLCLQATVEQIEMLKSTGMLIMRPPTVTTETKRDASVFAGMADVRVHKARVWVDGAVTANHELQVSITHTGAEEIVSRDGHSYRFSHEPIGKIFRYNLQDRVIIEDADFGISQSDGAVAHGERLYAAVGPFVAWQIAIDPDANLHLDLSGVSAVTLEFHGTNYLLER